VVLTVFESLEQRFPTLSTIASFGGRYFSCCDNHIFQNFLFWNVIKSCDEKVVLKAIHTVIPYYFAKVHNRNANLNPFVSKDVLELPCT